MAITADRGLLLDSVIMVSMPEDEGLVELGALGEFIRRRKADHALGMWRAASLSYLPHLPTT